MSSSEVQANIAEYAQLAAEFKQAQVILPSKWSRYQTHITVLLVLLSFISLSATFIHRKSGALKYFSSASVASAVVALLAVYACNFFGVYI